MEEEEVEAHAKAELHRNYIEINPHAFKLLILDIHKLMHPSKLLHAFFFRICYLSVKIEHFIFK